MMKKTVRSFLLLGLFTVVSGCGASAQSLCDDACECTGCSDSQADACLDAFEDGELDAEQADCLSEYDDLPPRHGESFECVNDLPTYEGCGGELVNLIECAGAQTDG